MLVYMDDFKKFLIFSFLLAPFLISIVLAQESLPGDWKGYAYINGSIAPDGTPVSAVIGTSWVANTTVGAVESGTGYYLIHVPGNSGDKVKFKICGVNVTLDEQDWSPGPHPNATTGSPYINLSITTLADGQSCTYACGCTGGYCVHGYCRSSSTYCGDGFCDSGETCSNCASDCGTCPGAVTGVGAGAYVPTVVEVTQTIATASPTTPAIASIPSDKAKDLKVDEVRVEVKETVSNVQITVKESSLPTGANVAISTDVGATYKYIEITTNVLSAKVEKIKVKFKVEKTWISANNIDETKVSLQRWADNKWNKLPTSKVSEDATYVYYEAESPGLSVFAVTGEKKVVKATCPFECCIGEANYTDKACPSGYECKNRKCVALAPPAPVCGNGICETGEDYTNCPADCPCSCTSWSNVSCGISPCKQNEMKQTRTCTPSKCDLEERCIEDPKCIPPKPPTWVIAIAIVIIILILFVLYKKSLMKM
jgi:PGF-pre-PGF domain-containing protein